jgi:hypothetical protein
LYMVCLPGWLIAWVSHQCRKLELVRVDPHQVFEFSRGSDISRQTGL